MEAWLDIQPIRIPRPKLVPSRPSHSTAPIVSTRCNGDQSGNNSSVSNQTSNNQSSNQPTRRTSAT